MIDGPFLLSGKALAKPPGVNRSPDLMRSKPMARDAEMSLLGAMLGGGYADPRSVWTAATDAQLDAQWFHDPAAGDLFALLCRARQDGRDADLMAVTTFAAETGSGIEAVFITECFTAAGNPHTAIETLRNYRDARELDDTADRIRAAVAGDLTEIQSAKAGILERLLAGKADSARALSGREALFACMDSIERQMTSQEAPGVPTGLAALDAKTGGIVPGLTLIGAETSGGKSVLAIQFALALLRAGKRVLFYSLEMTTDMNVRRMLCHLSGLNFRRVISPVPAFTSGEHSDFHRAVREFSQFAELLTIRDGDLSPSELVTDVRTRNAAAKVDAVIVDYIQILTPDDSRATPEQQLTSASGKLRGLAIELGIPVITPVQLNDADKVRGSRMLTNDAEVFVRIVHERDSEGQPVEPDEHGRRQCGLWIEKNRNGERWFMIPAQLDGARMRITETQAQRRAA